MKVKTCEPKITIVEDALQNVSEFENENYVLEYVVRQQNIYPKTTAKFLKLTICESEV